MVKMLAHRNWVKPSDHRTHSLRCKFLNEHLPSDTSEEIQIYPHHVAAGSKFEDYVSRSGKVIC
jgi:hypothetical protein